MFSFVEYIWIDGAKPSQGLRCKTRILDFGDSRPNLSLFPVWGYDGSSTNQSTGHFSDLVLKPVNFVKDPIRGDGHYLVLCEVFNVDGTPHESNTRAKLREEMQRGAPDEDAWIGFEQEYTMYEPDGRRPYKWPEHKEPEPQGPYYCSVGADRAWGRSLSEGHAGACVMAGLAIYGTNAEVMPSQWEFQIGYRGVKSESADPLTISDHLWLARWLLHRIGEDIGISVSLSQKPMKGDWNGAGMHTNFSTRAMRDEKTGWGEITKLVEGLSTHHKEHIAEYGAGLEERLTGHHETCDINTFKMGECDRGASIRIPEPVVQKRCGYIEDRRPGANADPYRISTRLLKTLHEIK
ncbi:MAG: glutamine synthetase beta-grasp domain-containing protein [Myxococcota bacterium]